MTRRIFPALTAFIVLPLALGLGAAGAYAHGARPGHVHQAPIQGIVTSTGSQLVVQTASGSVSSAITSSTHVTRVAAGSLADLTKGEMVDIRPQGKTTTSQQVTIEPAGDAPSHPKTAIHKAHVVKAPKKAHTWTGKAHPSMHGHGQIVTVTSNTVVVRDHSGQTTTFTLSASTTITKVMRGTVKDLAVGQTVRLFKNTAGSAVSVEILDS